MTIVQTGQPATLRTLSKSDEAALLSHLLRLDAVSRRNRFNGGVSDEFLKAYVRRCFSPGSIVVGYWTGAVLRGAAELHPAPAGWGDALPEIAFSVEPELRRQGVGSALFGELLDEALRGGYHRLRVTTSGDNAAMKALATKFGARLSFESGEASGVIDLDARAASKAPLAPAPFLPAFAAARTIARTHDLIWQSMIQATAGVIARSLNGTR